MNREGGGDLARDSHFDTAIGQRLDDHEYISGTAAAKSGYRIEVRFRIAPPRGPKPAQQAVRAELVRVSHARGTLPAPDPGVFRRRGLVVATEEGDPLRADTEYRLADPVLKEEPGALEGGTLNMLL